MSIAMLLGVRSTVAEIYSVDSACIEPELPRHSRVLVFKLASDFKPGQILAYRPDLDHVYLGRVDATDPASRRVTISRNGAAPSPVPFEKVIGRVILNSR